MIGAYTVLPSKEKGKITRYAEQNCFIDLVYLILCFFIHIFCLKANTRHQGNVGQYKSVTFVESKEFAVVQFVAAHKFSFSRIFENYRPT